MIRTVLVVLLATALAACESTGRTANGTPVSIQPVEERTIHDAMLWFPKGIIETQSSFSVFSRNNSHPIEEMTFRSGQGWYRAQFLRGYGIGFNRETTRGVLDVDTFRTRATALGVRDYELDNITEFGSSYTTNGGVYARYERGQYHCIAGRVGAGLGGFNVALSTHGAPYDTIIVLSFCGTLEQTDDVENFLVDPQQVEDRAAYQAYVDEILAESGSQNGSTPKT